MAAAHEFACKRGGYKTTAFVFHPTNGGTLLRNVEVKAGNDTAVDAMCFFLNGGGGGGVGGRRGAVTSYVSRPNSCEVDWEQFLIL